MSNLDDQFSLDDFSDSQTSGFGPSTPSPIRGTVKVGKTEYAVDLQWETPQDPSKVAKEARAYAAGQSDPPDFFCVRKGVKTQYGLGYSSMGHKTNLPSLAAHICQSKGSSFIALFEVDGGYYLLAVRDDSILSDAERFISHLGEAAQELGRLIGQYDFPEIIAPSSLDIDGSREQSIESLLSGSTPVRLKDINKSRGYIRLGLAAAAAAIVLFGVKFYWDSIEQAKIEAELKAQFEAAQVKVGLAEPKIEIPKMPWDGAVMGARVLETCFKEIQKFPLDIPGWTIDSMDCVPVGTAASIGVIIRRDKAMEDGGATILDAMQMAKFNGLNPSFAPTPNGSSGPFGFQWSVGDQPRIAADIKTETRANIEKSVMLIMESRHTEVSFSPADSNDFWDGVNIEFKTSLSPVSFADVLDAIPGFMLTSLEYQIEDNIYTVKGKAYEQKPLPENVQR
jgi:hypothetical protein